MSLIIQFQFDGFSCLEALNPMGFQKVLLFEIIYMSVCLRKRISGLIFLYYELRWMGSFFAFNKGIFVSKIGGHILCVLLPSFLILFSRDKIVIYKIPNLQNMQKHNSYIYIYINLLFILLLSSLSFG